MMQFHSEAGIDSIPRLVRNGFCNTDPTSTRKAKCSAYLATTYNISAAGDALFQIIVRGDDPVAKIDYYNCMTECPWGTDCTDCRRWESAPAPQPPPPPFVNWDGPMPPPPPRPPPGGVSSPPPSPSSLSPPTPPEEPESTWRTVLVWALVGTGVGVVILCLQFGTRFVNFRIQVGP